MARLPEEEESLWWLTVSPTIWAVHFLAAYITVAVWCEKVSTRDGPLDGARIAVAVFTAVALTGIGANTLRAWRHHRHEQGRTPHHEDTPEDRHRFIGFASFLLSALSAVGVVYATLPILFIETCR